MKHLNALFLLAIVLLACNDESVIELTGKKPETSKSTALGPFKIKNYWKSEFIVVTSGVPSSSTSEGGRWEFIAAGTSLYYIRDASSTKYLVDNGSGTLTLSAQNTTNAKWMLELTSTNASTTPGSATTLVRIKNVDKNYYINVEAGLKDGTIQSGWYSAMWYIY